MKHKVFDAGPPRPPAAGRADATELLGIPISRTGSAQILEYMSAVIAARQQAVILHANIHLFNLVARHPWLMEYFNRAQLVFCDGDGVRLGLRIMGFSPPPKITYNVWLWHLARWCEGEGFSIYLLGARPGVADRAALNLKARYPRLLLLGAHDGYFDKRGPENDEVVAEINRLRPDVLLVCFGMPLQEEWVRDNSSRLSAHVILTGGAALDYGAGIVRVAPSWMVRYHLEWAFRLFLEPVRLFSRYIIGNPRFVGRVLAERLRRVMRGGQSASPNERA